MFYTKEYVINELKDRLNGLVVEEKNDNNKIIFELTFKGHKANVDIDNFITRLTEKRSDKSDKLLSKFVFYIENNFLSQFNFSLDNITKNDFVNSIYPIIRSTTFGKNSNEEFITKDHTNETKIFYALDLKNSYKLLTKNIISRYNINEEEIYNLAQKNLKKLPLNYNVDEVMGNKFYFLNSKDGYDGSRILNDEVLQYFYKKIGGDFYLGIPNQDAVIFADIKNKKGLEILQKTMVHFFTEGIVPITTITFKYDSKKLESLFIFIE